MNIHRRNSPSETTSSPSVDLPPHRLADRVVLQRAGAPCGPSRVPPRARRNGRARRTPRSPTRSRRPQERADGLGSRRRPHAGSHRTQVESGARNSQPRSVGGRSGSRRRPGSRSSRMSSEPARGADRTRPPGRSASPIAKARCAPSFRWMSNAVGVGPPPRVAVGRGQDGADQGAGRERHARQLHVHVWSGGSTVPTGPAHRSVSSTAAFTSERSARTSASCVGVRAERPHRERDHVPRLLQPTGEHQLRVRHDLLVGHPIAVLLVPEHPRQDRAVGLVLETIQHRSMAPRRARRSPRRRAPASRRSPSKFARPSIRPSFQARMSCHGDLVEAEHEPQGSHAHRVAVRAEQVGLTPVAVEPVDQLVRELGDHALRSILDVARAERRLDDRADPALCSGPSDPSMFTPIVRLSVEGPVAAVNELGVQVHRADVVVAGHEPELDGRHPAHRLLLAEPLRRSGYGSRSSSSSVIDSPIVTPPLLSAEAPRSPWRGDSVMGEHRVGSAPADDQDAFRGEGRDRERWRHRHRCRDRELVRPRERVGHDHGSAAGAARGGGGRHRRDGDPRRHVGGGRRRRGGRCHRRAVRGPGRRRRERRPRPRRRGRRRSRTSSGRARST